MDNNEWVAEQYRLAPWHVKFVISRLLDWANHIDFMGYEPEYFLEDIPKFVDRILNPEKYD